MKREEVKKVNKIPYFSVKVVEIKKAEREKLYCPVCNSELKREKPLDNFVNGENLDKIKFPCFCSFMFAKKDHIGMLIKTSTYPDSINEYQLIGMECQGDNCIFSNKYESLRALIETWDIHILKGQIKIIKEREEK
jgi:hypothetical protein